MNSMNEIYLVKKAVLQVLDPLNTSECLHVWESF